jgi:hypothetical protein
MRRFSEMPWLLRILVGASLGIGLVFPLLPFIPAATFELEERELTNHELWQTRVAFALFAVGLLMLVVAAGVFLRKRWIRPVLIILPVLQTLPFLVAHWTFGAPNPISSPGTFAATCAIWAVCATVYLFTYPSTRQHFANAV